MNSWLDRGRGQEMNIHVRTLSLKDYILGCASRLRTCSLPLPCETVRCFYSVDSGPRVCQLHWEERTVPRETGMANSIVCFVFSSMVLEVEESLRLQLLNKMPFMLHHDVT